MKPPAWSHSALESFETCPRKHEQVKVLKFFAEPKNDAASWGDEFHRAAEVYIKAAAERRPIYGVDEAIAGMDEHTMLPKNMVQYAPYLRPFIERPGKTFAERKYALTIGLTPCGFFDKATWLRAIIDVLTLNGSVAHVDDHKTGRNRKKDMQQLIVFALATFYTHPEIDTVHTAYHWLQHGFGEDAKDREVFYRYQIPDLWMQLVPKLERYKAAFGAGIFQPKPSGLCKRHCPVNTCEYWGSGRR